MHVKIYTEMKYRKRLETYKAYMQSVLKLIAAEAGISGRDKAITKAVESIVHLERLIASGVNSHMYTDLEGISNLEALQKAIGNEVRRLRFI